MDKKKALLTSLAALTLAATANPALAEETTAPATTEPVAAGTAEPTEAPVLDTATAEVSPETSAQTQAASETPVEEAAPATSAAEAAPATSEAPAAEAAPATSETPAAEAASATSEAPAAEAAPVSQPEVAPATRAAEEVSSTPSLYDATYFSGKWDYFGIGGSLVFSEDGTFTFEHLATASTEHGKFDIQGNELILNGTGQDTLGPLGDTSATIKNVKLIYAPIGETLPKEFVNNFATEGENQWDPFARAPRARAFLADSSKERLFTKGGDLFTRAGKPLKPLIVANTPVEEIPVQPSTSADKDTPAPQPEASEVAVMPATISFRNIPSSNQVAVKVTVPAESVRTAGISDRELRFDNVKEYFLTNMATGERREMASYLAHGGGTSYWLVRVKGDETVYEGESTYVFPDGTYTVTVDSDNYLGRYKARLQGSNQFVIKNGVLVENPTPADKGDQAPEAKPADTSAPAVDYALWAGEWKNSDGTVTALVNTSSIETTGAPTDLDLTYRYLTAGESYSVTLGTPGNLGKIGVRANKDTILVLGSKQVDGVSYTVFVQKLEKVTKPSAEAPKTPETTTKPSAEAAKKPETATKPSAETVKKPETATKPSAETVKKPETATKPSAEAAKKPATVAKPSAEAAKKPETAAKPSAETVKTPEKTADAKTDFSSYAGRYQADSGDQLEISADGTLTIGNQTAKLTFKNGQLTASGIAGRGTFTFDAETGTIFFPIVAGLEPSPLESEESLRERAREFKAMLEHSGRFRRVGQNSANASDTLKVPVTTPLSAQDSAPQASYSRVAAAKQAADQGILPSTGETVSILGLLGAGLSALGLAGFKRRK